VLDLIEGEKGIKREISRDFNAMIPMSSLANGKPRARIDLKCRAWNIFRSHRQNYLKFGGLLGDTTT